MTDHSEIAAEPEQEEAAVPAAVFDVESVRADFPYLQAMRNGRPIIYLDNAATTQKPRQVIERLNLYYRAQNANVHRGVHYLSQVATDEYEDARRKTAKFLNSPLTCEIIFTRGTTEGINLVANSFGCAYVKEGDEILITHLEHHSNIVPWQILCEQRGARLKVAPIDENGEVLLDEYKALLNERTRLVGINHVSNALGTVNPVKQMIKWAHDAGAAVLVDGAQSAPHMQVDVQELDCDFFVCSGHKLCGPTGIGVLYGRAKYLEEMPPYQGGGDMILSVDFEKTTYNTLPYKFEAGTPIIAGAIGLGAAIDYMNGIGMERIAQYEEELVSYGEGLLAEMDGVRLIGRPEKRAAVLSFVMDEAHPHDIGQILDESNVAIRAGHHCAQPLMKFFGVPATARASLAFYNTKEELDALVEGIRNVREVFA